MSVDEAAISSLLTKHVPEVLAQMLLRRARGDAGKREGRGFLDDLRTGVRLFVEPHLQRAILADLDALAKDRRDLPRERIRVASEADVSRARLRARELSQQLGGGAFGAQRASTAVSELARNIIMYAGKGEIELTARSGPPPYLTVRASDQGPGIAQKEAVLNGTFRSTTGLGRGLMGVKRLAAQFDVQSSPAGTIVEASIPL